LGTRHGSHQRDGVTVAARRDAPGGVGTRNVPQDSPTPPARVEQGTMASKKKASEGACPTAAAGRSPAPCEARLPSRLPRLNQKESRPRRLANPTPAGVLFSPSQPFANPSPMTSAAGRRLFCISDAPHGNVYSPDRHRVNQGLFKTATEPCPPPDPTVGSYQLSFFVLVGKALPDSAKVC
jgi:hypothetical protein